ncbi:MAG: glycine oxidase ThiO [Mycobacteriales bacterium]
MDATADVVVVGGGVIGLACAWRLAGLGLAVQVVDPDPGSGASRAAAGMLAPVTEAHFGEEQLVALTLASAAAYPGFVEELCQATGADVGFRESGTLAVALEAGDRAALADLAGLQARLGLEVTLLSGREARRLEPTLAPGIAGGSYAAGDHQVDPRRLTAALLAALSARGAALRRARVSSLIGADRVSGVRLADGERIQAGTVVLAAGAWSGALAPPGLVPVRPVKGQILRLGAGPLPPAHSVRPLVEGRPCYVVPRADGEIVVGATVEEMGFDTTVLAGAVSGLLRDATAVLPGLAECSFVEACAGLRPATPDNAPLVGPAGPAGLVLATGHYRNGILLAPLTADAIASAVGGEGLPPAFAPFPADRFAAAAVPG